jgi:hypothetical protein
MRFQALAHNKVATSPQANGFARVQLLEICCLLLLALEVVADGVSMDPHPVRFSTFFGGAQNDGAYAMALDREGNAWIAGSTSSRDSFPLLNPLQAEHGGGEDLFIARFNPNGELLFSTFFGGSGTDEPNAIAVHPDGHIIVVGYTRSIDFPVTEGAFQEEYAGGSAFGTGDGFILKLSGDGSRVLYASYFGGSGDDFPTGVAVGTDGSVYVVGETDSLDLPLKNPLQAVYAGGRTDGFVARFAPDLSSILFSSYLGGSNTEEWLRVALDPAQHIYICGGTLSTDFPVTDGAFQTVHHVLEDFENMDAFVVRLEPGGAGFVYSTYLGNATGDAAWAIAADAEGYAYITGLISASWNEEDFQHGFQPEPGFGNSDAYVAKFKPDGSGLVWFSYLGGSAEDIGFDLALDADGDIYVTGITNSRDFPLVDAAQGRYGGGAWDTFVCKISADGKRLLYSSYLGGRSEEWGYGVDVDAAGAIWVAGQTMSSDFPTRNAWQPAYHAPESGGRVFDACLTRLFPRPEPPPLNVVRSGGSVVITWPIRFEGFTLEYRDSAASESAWKAVTSATLQIGGQHTVIERSDTPSRLYRLYRP